MNVYDCAKQRRTIRVFSQKSVDRADLLEILDCARLAPSAANIQPIKFAIVKSEAVRKAMCPHIKYAGYLPDFNPNFEQTPPVFIAVLSDTALKPAEKGECDFGTAIMSMCLAATQKGLGTCWLGAINREEIKKFSVLPRPSMSHICSVLAIRHRRRGLPK